MCIGIRSRARRVLALTPFVLIAFWRAEACAQNSAVIEVDLELVLAVDISRSMNPREMEIQRQGYKAALVDDAVLAAISRGYLGQIAVTYMEWAEAEHQRIVVDWTLIRDKRDAEAFVARMQPTRLPNLRLTSISHAIDQAVALIVTNDYSAPRQVIDISGDGPSNDGRTITFARDDAVARGVTINGLPLMTREGVGGAWYLDDLDIYYKLCVIGGPDAFVLPVHDWADFPDAVRRKLLLELSSKTPPPHLTARPARFQHAAARDRYDCRITDAVWGPTWWYRR